MDIHLESRQMESIGLVTWLEPTYTVLNRARDGEFVQSASLALLLSSICLAEKDRGGPYNKIMLWSATSGQKAGFQYRSYQVLIGDDDEGDQADEKSKSRSIPSIAVVKPPRNERSPPVRNDQPDWLLATFVNVVSRGQR